VRACLLRGAQRGVGGDQRERGGLAGVQGLALVPISAQLELTLPLFAQLKPTLSPI